MTLDRARLSTQYYIDRLRTQVSALRSLQYPGNHPGPQKWLSLIWGILDTAQEYLRKSAQTEDQEEARSKIQDSRDLAKQAYKHLDFMSGAGIDDLPHPVVRPLQRWFDQFNIKNTIFFHIEHSPIYELYHVERDDFLRIRDPSESLQLALTNIDWPLFRVTVPSRELGIVPHFSLVAHEVGHAIYPFIQFDFTAFQAQEEKLRDQAYIASESDVDGDDKLLLDFLHEVTGSWIKEIAADAIAYLLTGPAFYFGLCEFFQQAYGGYGLCRTHPPFDLRREVLHKRLTDGNPSFAEIFRHYTSQDLSLDFNSVLVLPTPSKEQVTHDVLLDMLMDGKRDHGKAAVLANMADYIKLIAPSVFDQTESFIQQHYPECIYYPQNYSADLSEHLELMLAAIPPIEHGNTLENKSPTEFATILNVGWVTLLSKLEDLKVKDSDASKFGAQKAESLHSLLLKAVELSETRRLWDSSI